jgi:O-antigen ligase
VGFGITAAHVLTVWGLAVSNAALGLAILWGLYEHRRLRWDWKRTAPLLVPLGLYVIFFLVSILASLDPAASFDDLVDVLTLSTLVMAVLWVRGEDQVRRLVDWLVAMTAVLGVYGIVQYLVTDYGPLHQRIPGPFSHYMTYSGVLLVGDFLLLGRLLAGAGRPAAAASRPAYRRPWSWAALAIINTALLLTLTRGAWVAAGVTVTVALWIRVRRWFAAYVAAALVAGMLLLAVAPASWTERMRSIADLSDGSNYDRLCMAQAAFYMIGERPLFGIGPAMVFARYPIYRHPTAPRYTVKHLHNTFLHLAAERGLLSLGAYLWLMAAGLGLALRGFRREGGDRGGRADLYLGVILALVGFNLAGLFEANWRDTEVQRLVLFVLAVPCCLQADDPPDRPATSATPAR